MSAFKTCFVKAPGMTHKKCPCKGLLGITFKLTQRLGLTKPSTQIKKELNQELNQELGWDTNYEANKPLACATLPALNCYIFQYWCSSCIEGVMANDTLDRIECIGPLDHVTTETTVIFLPYISLSRSQKNKHR